MQCGTRWCNRPTAKSSGSHRRSIGGIELCRSCYQYLWEYADKHNMGLEQAMAEAPDQRRPLPLIEAVCPRAGCGRTLTEDMDRSQRRSIGKIHVCRPCYNRAWEVAKAREIGLEEALSLLSPVKLRKS